MLSNSSPPTPGWRDYSIEVRVGSCRSIKRNRTCRAALAMKIPVNKNSKVTRIQCSEFRGGVRLATIATATIIPASDSTTCAAIQ